jgi:hypothetical protein
LYANSISSGRLQSSDVKKNLVGAAAILATPLVIYSIPAIIYGLSTGAASGAAMFASNPETAIGLMGLTMSILDPSPVHDYPGGFDDILRGAKILVKNKGVQRFIFRTGRFKYMFGKGTGSSNNVKRSLDNLSALEKMGITDNQAGRQKLLGYFDKAMDSETTNLHLNPNNGKWEGWKVVDVVEDGVYKGKLQVGVSYADEMMKSTPEVTTIIPMPSKK